MLALWMFGVELERMWGSRFFVQYYFICGVGAAMTTILLSFVPGSFGAQLYYSLTIGASGAIYGILLAYALYFPNRPILLYFIFPVPAKYFVAIMIDPDRTTARKIVDVGQEEGRIIQPSGFDTTAEGSFVVADVPRGQERLQIFGPGALRTGGFFIAGRSMPQVIIGNYALTGISSLQFNGGSIFVSEPERGSLITEYSTAGVPQRTIGRLRATGHASRRSLCTRCRRAPGTPSPRAPPRRTTRCFPARGEAR